MAWRSFRAEKAAEPPTLWEGAEMLSAPAPGEYSTGQLHSLAGSGTFFIKQCLPPHTYDGQAV